MITIFMFSTCTYIQSITMRSILSINILVSGPESLYHDKSTIDTNPLALWPRPARPARHIERNILPTILYSLSQITNDVFK